jgi:glycosyltransferase involved in cell wall biosynthesis
MHYLGRVAIVTRTKDRTTLLERAVQSVLDQSFQDWFMVIVNDGGVKESVDRLVSTYCSRFNGRVAVIHNEESLGREAASNQGIAYGHSDYIAIHDDDDSWAPSFLEMCVSELEKATEVLPSIQGVVTYTLRVHEHIDKGVVITDYIDAWNKWIPKGVLSVFSMTEKNLFPPISFVYRRSALESTGTYREDLPILGDWEFNLRFMAQFDIYLIPYALAFYHHRQSTSAPPGNALAAGIQTQELYSEYLRNELIRRDLRGESNGLGTLMSLSRRLRSIEDQVHMNSGSFHHMGADMSSQLSGVRRIRWAPFWALASVMQFSKSAGKRELISKFLKHSREDGLRQALAVLTRYGYLSTGGL